MASIYTTTDGDILCDGLQGCHTCDEAMQIAARTAAERDEAVLLSDDDGEWICYPNGSFERDGDES